MPPQLSATRIVGVIFFLAAVATAHAQAALPDISQQLENSEDGDYSVDNGFNVVLPSMGYASFPQTSYLNKDGVAVSNASTFFECSQYVSMGTYANMKIRGSVGYRKVVLDASTTARYSSATSACGPYFSADYLSVRGTTGVNQSMSPVASVNATSAKSCEVYSSKSDTVHYFGKTGRPCGFAVDHEMTWNGQRIVKTTVYAPQANCGLKMPTATPESLAAPGYCNLSANEAKDKAPSPDVCRKFGSQICYIP